MGVTLTGLDEATTARFVAELDAERGPLWPGAVLRFAAASGTVHAIAVDGAPVGFVVVEPVDDAVAALTVWVRPDDRRRGHARAAVAAATAGTDGLIVADVDHANTAGLALFGSVGATRSDAAGTATFTIAGTHSSTTRR